jgi:uncharacterized protein (DUF1697 family)
MFVGHYGVSFAVKAIDQRIPLWVVRVEGRHAYIVYPNGIGRSRLTNALIEKKLRTRGTGRNWNTVLKLNELVATSSKGDRHG